MRPYVSISAAVLEPKRGRSENSWQRHLPVVFPLKRAASPFPPIAHLAAKLGNDLFARPLCPSSVPLRLVCQESSNPSRLSTSPLIPDFRWVRWIFRRLMNSG